MKEIESMIMKILKENSTFVDGQIKGLIVHGAIEKIAEYIIAGRSKSIEREKELEDGLKTLITEYEYAMKLLAEATGQVYSENNVTIPAKQLLTK